MAAPTFWPDTSRNEHMSRDISDILREWRFEPGRNVRKIVGEDGREKLQVRLPMGIEQYELHGRPDGRQPRGNESLLDYYTKRRDAFREKHGTDAGFSLDDVACQRLRDEGILYYFRYLVCFQIGEYELVARDTERNLDLIDFTKRYAASEEDVTALEQYRPYIIRMNASARAMQTADSERIDEALRTVRAAIQEILALPEIDTPTFAFERKRSLGILRGMENEINEKKPLSERGLIERRLREAVASENYERAAKLRDVLRRMG